MKSRGKAFVGEKPSEFKIQLKGNSAQKYEGGGCNVMYHDGKCALSLFISI